MMDVARGGMELVWIHRPILVHEARPKHSRLCQCGCGSARAKSVREIEHIDLLIDRVEGTRKLLADQQGWNIGKWHELASTAKKIDMPVRCYAKQLPLILDDTHKVIGLFGGVRSGKSTGLAEWFIDGVLKFSSL